MNALEYARKYVLFWKDSPITGAFDDGRYKMLRKPLLSVSDIACKDLVIFGPAQSVKTVLNEIATAYALDYLRCSVLAVAQTDDDAKEYARTKLNPFLRRLKALLNTAITAQTLGGWMWATNELIISGPGENAQNSKSVRRVHTDEAHLYHKSNPGALVALNGRMGLRWDRQQLDTTTAPDAGSECDLRFHNGRQNEWHLSCIKCGKLFMPLWKDASRASYNGHEVFQWEESQSETATLDSIRLHCPHCDSEFSDTRFTREGLDEGADYIPQKPNADDAWNSFRWNAFAPMWMPWRDLFGIYRNAIASAKVGELQPYRDWVTKREVRTWTGEYPMLGDSTRGRNYMLGDIQKEPDTLLTMTIDQQEGKGGQGFHLWCGIDRWFRDGNSHRVAYERKATYDDAKAMQITFGVKDENTAIDYGQGMREREIFAACARFHWIALKSGDDDSYSHVIATPGKVSQVISLPYSASFLESAHVGTTSQKGILTRARGGQVPPGFCIARMWSKPKLYAIFYALKDGDTGKSYNIAKDMPSDYLDQIHAYIPGEAMDKATGTVKKVIWRKVRNDDHAWVVSVQNMLMAILAGFFPMSKREVTTIESK